MADWWDTGDFSFGDAGGDFTLDPSLFDLGGLGGGTGIDPSQFSLGGDQQMFFDTLTQQVVDAGTFQRTDPAGWSQYLTAKNLIGGASALGGLGMLGLGIGGLFGGSDAQNRTTSQTSTTAPNGMSPQALQLLGGGAGTGTGGLAGGAGGGGTGLLGLSDMMLRNLMGPGQGGAQASPQPVQAGGGMPRPTPLGAGPGTLSAPGGSTAFNEQTGTYAPGTGPLWATAQPGARSLPGGGLDYLSAPSGGGTQVGQVSEMPGGVQTRGMGPGGGQGATPQRWPTPPGLNLPAGYTYLGAMTDTDNVGVADALGRQFAFDPHTNLLYPSFPTQPPQPRTPGYMRQGGGPGLGYEVNPPQQPNWDTAENWARALGQAPGNGQAPPPSGIGGATVYTGPQGQPQQAGPQQTGGQPGLIGQQSSVLGGLQGQIPQLNPAIMQALGQQAGGMAQGYLPALNDPNAQARIQSIYQPGFDALNYNSGLALSNAREQLQQRGFQAPDIREGPTQALTAPILAAQQLGRSQLYGQMAGAQLDLASRLPMLGSQLNAQNYATQLQPFNAGLNLAGAYNQPIGTQGQFGLSLLDILNRGQGSTQTVNTVGPQPSLTTQIGQLAPTLGAAGGMLSSAGNTLFPPQQNPYGFQFNPFTGASLSGIG